MSGNDSEVCKRVRVRTIERAASWRNGHPEDNSKITFELNEDEIKEIKRSIFIRKYYEVPMGLIFCFLIFFTMPNLARAEYTELMNAYQEACELQRALPQLVRIQTKPRLMRRAKRLNER